VISASVVGAAGGLLVLGAVLRLILQGRMRVRYAGLWLLVSAGLAFVALVPGLLSATSEFFGFQVPSNFLFFTGMVLLVLVGINLSVAVTTLEDRIQRLAEEFALLAEKVREDR
jgi:hypothetical protein